MRKRIYLSGQVQGVGCRPYIYRLAVRYALAGYVCNDTSGVVVEVQGSDEQVAGFMEHLEAKGDLPALMNISSLRSKDIDDIDGEKQFRIGASSSAGSILSQVTADSATCADCLDEMCSEDDFRCRYPFINCTNCGPRYSIVQNIPYDRCNTTMQPFQMCDNCRREYTDVADRRFHAQPVACETCGPKISLCNNLGNTIEDDSDAVIAKTAELLHAGKIAAIKGLGGFHLAVDALNEEAVCRLRRRKQRDHKPFALMAGNIEKIREFAEVDEIAESLLKSPESPIVLLPAKAGKQPKIADSVAAGSSNLGFMLCYTPLHHLLFAENDIEVLVMTSANISDEPLICENGEALEKLSGIADAFLMHNRDIYRQVDDSVVQIVDGGPAMLRRSRGYVPVPIPTSNRCEKHIFAAGADLKNTFCFGKDKKFILSEHIGDLKEADVYRHYGRSVKHLQKLFEVEPRVFACDMHPGYLSSQFAKKLSDGNVLEIQHHWAHIASVLAEYDHHEKVIGLVADGTGLGTDGAIWGCECLIASLSDFQRFGQLEYYPLAGGDTAAKEAIRPLMGLLSQCDEDYMQKYGQLLEGIEADRSKLDIIADQLKRNVNVARTSSLGRLFDAVAAMAGLGKHNHFEAQLPIALEAIVKSGLEKSYNVQINSASDGTFKVDFRTMVKQIADDIESGVSKGVVSTKFHNCLAGSLLALAQKARDNYGLKTVALSGGVFCNRYLSNRLIRLLKNEGFFVLFKRRVPANDGGISLGQAAIAAEKFQK
ncbi:MAG: carbamoyltransferase HypF [Planctomycetes bacterium]|nr:carbamoyltransferase HypF [Planctomycetota bacterium]